MILKIGCLVLRIEQNPSASAMAFPLSTTINVSFFYTLKNANALIIIEKQESGIFYAVKKSDKCPKYPAFVRFFYTPAGSGC